MSKGYKTTIINQSHEPTKADVLSIARDIIMQGNYNPPDYVLIYSPIEKCWVNVCLKDMRESKEAKQVILYQLEKMGIYLEK